MIPSNEKLISLAEAAVHVGSRYGVSYSRQAVFRWAKAGIRGCTLETRLVGPRRRTSAEAIERFFAAIDASPSACPPWPILAGPLKPRGMSREAAEALIT